MSAPDDPLRYNGQPYDYRLANVASAVDHCMKLGAVVLSREEQGAGFRVRPDHAPQPERGSGHQRTA